MDKDVVLLAYSALREKYGVPEVLKRQQIDVIMGVIEKKHAFALLPTGFGKSYCFILPPLILDEIYADKAPHVAVVVSPLRSLMMDQVNNLQAKGIKACAVLQLAEMTKETRDGILAGEYSIVFMSPESIELQPWRSMFKLPHYKEKLCVVACDEAHCISQWGQDFRPTYRNVSVLRSICSKAPFLVLTATCTEKMKSEIFDCLLLQENDVKIVAIVPDRPNIFLSFSSRPRMKHEEELSWLVEDLKAQGVNSTKTVIYCRTISDASSIYEHLMWTLKDRAWAGEKRVENRIIEMFHSSISKGAELRVITEFPKEDSSIRCVVATIAFGMGIQVPDIRTVIHWGVSKSILSYMQEIGRAGRDNRPAKAYLYATLKSLDKRRTDESLLTWCNGIKDINSCMRVGLLEALTIPGMDIRQLTILRKRQLCELSCVDCQCVHCQCCSLCKDKCPCVIKKQVTDV